MLWKDFKPHKALCGGIVLVLIHPGSHQPMTDVLQGTKSLGDLLKMTQPASGTVKTRTPSFCLLQMQICCPGLCFKTLLFIFNKLQFTKECLWTRFCLSSQLWTQGASLTWGALGFFSFRKFSPVSLPTLPHSRAHQPHLLERDEMLPDLLSPASTLFMTHSFPLRCILGNLSFLFQNNTCFFIFI